MPAKSAKQYKFMQMMAHNPGMAKKKGMKSIKPSVAKEFIKKTPKKKRSMFMKED